MSSFNLGQILIGKPLQTADLPHQSISKRVGLAVFASDALSSTAYATEEILHILILAAGTTSLSLTALMGISLPIAVAIAVLLVIVTISYRQTILAYPNGGGAYIVARDNLGELPAQIAGAALLTDYILTVAVSVSSGVAQIVSAVPSLLPLRVWLAVGIIIFMTVVNLRGVKESGNIFAVPTYFFLVMMFFTLAVGMIRYFSGTLTPVEVEAIHVSHMEELSIFLVLRAFSSGCTALTGIEAISNGVTAFKEPRSRNAATTLIWMSGILITLFLGITFLANQVHALPNERETVISQMARAIYGAGSPLYFLVMLGTTLILLMAANTSYADFPRLAALHAGDGFLPRQLTLRGSRLVFSWGIMVLASAAILLVIVADARTTSLIPLYAVGVFLSFTISQAGMVVRFQRIGKLKPGEKGEGLETDLEYDKRWRLHQFISGLGALCTFVVMVVFAVTKFTSGAWFIVLLVPTLVAVFFQIHHHYRDVAKALSVSDNRLSLEMHAVKTIILVDDVHAETIRLVNFARSLNAPWHAMHVAVKPEKVAVVRDKWQKYIGEGDLVIVESPYRLLAEPIREHILKLQAETPGCFVHVIMGHLVMDSFWEQALHQNTALIFQLVLDNIERVAITSVPFQIHRKHHGQAQSAPNPIPAASDSVE
ncbi:MAG: APC family permease [Anaerolineae bacterium]|nr:APC family permease [Anaerolineae bacterium]MDW8172776.1 APC family permease [Anaerolineae bacterium]